jgi:hypothetical protein
MNIEHKKINPQPITLSPSYGTYSVDPNYVTYRILSEYTFIGKVMVYHDRKTQTHTIDFIHIKESKRNSGFGSSTLLKLIDELDIKHLDVEPFSLHSVRMLTRTLGIPDKINSKKISSSDNFISVVNEANLPQTVSVQFNGATNEDEVISPVATNLKFHYLNVKSKIKKS